MTKKISLVLDEEQALFVSAAIDLGAAVAASRDIKLVEACVEEITSMVEDGTVKKQTIYGLVNNATKIIDVYLEEPS